MPTCEICNNSMKSIYRHMSRKEKAEFWRCPACGLRWVSNLEFDKSFQSKLDEANRQKALEGIRDLEFVQVNKLVRQYVKKGGRGLDVGCSYGWYLESIGKEYQIEGIEPEKEIAKKAGEMGYTVYQGFFPDDIPENAGKYNFIVFNNVWEHINHTVKLLGDSIKFLENGGFLFVTVPLSTGGVYRIAESFEKIGWTKWLVRLWQLHFHSPHIYYFEKKNLVWLMEKYGCKLLRVEDVRNNIDPKRMKERLEMDTDEKYGGFKAFVFRIIFPFIKKLPADKAVFVFRYEGSKLKENR